MVSTSVPVDAIARLLALSSVAGRCVQKPVASPPAQPVTPRAKIGRNDPCPCKSGRKFKRCHGDRRFAV